MTDPMTTRTRYEEYLICQQRGHLSTLMLSVWRNGEMVEVCEYCGTHYWTEHIKRESNTPAETNPEDIGLEIEVREMGPS